jgi:hypothetical protein
VANNLKEPRVPLLSFLRGPNFVPRERLMHVRAIAEMKLHGALHDAVILVSEPEIDMDGYDCSVTSEYDSILIQNKVALSRNGAREWSVRGSLLRPGFGDRDLLPLFRGLPLWASLGGAGCVLLHLVDEDAAGRDELKVTYHLCDIFYLAAVAFGVAASDRMTAHDAGHVLRAIQNSGDGDHVTLPRRAFLPLKSAASIVALRLGIPAQNNYVSSIAQADEDPQSAGEKWARTVGQWVM